MTANYLKLVVTLTANSAVISSHTDYQLSHCLQSVLVFNSKPFFLFLITSPQWIGSQRGVQMEVPRDKYLDIQTLLEPYFFVFWSASKVTNVYAKKKANW